MEKADTKWKNARDPGFASNDNYMLVNKQLAKANPKAMAFLDGMRMPRGDVSVLMARTQGGEDSRRRLGLWPKNGSPSPRQSGTR
ncbi:hypothetical protein MPL3356_10038 [Mesorhizobium plurifarium]|uniref:Uncharacterized protein n=1 Tax=Mesorhizobium plurifarium TaxID=69974 RepID=A0A090EWD8_MESPL|nr:hypothetical protein MPL3356_10038 [Mesorhizobium plurifarium]